MSYQPQHLVFDPSVDPRYLAPYYHVVAKPYYEGYNTPAVYPQAPTAGNGFFNNPNTKAGLASGAGALLGGLFMPNSSMGAGIGGALGPVIYSMITPEQESTGQILGQALGGGLGGGFGKGLAGPLGAGLGGSLGGGFGGYLGQRF